MAEKWVGTDAEITDYQQILHFSFHIVIFVDFHGNMLHNGNNCKRYSANSTVL